MDETRASPDLDWVADEVPVSRRFGDPYYSLAGGLAETRHVFLEGNDLGARFVAADSDVTVAELGFGTGLAFLATLDLWRRCASPGARLRFVSFELQPLAPAQMRRALAVWPELAADAGHLTRYWPGDSRSRIRFDRADLEVIRGDARRTVADWSSRAQAWFLDGFAPARNPEMWEARLLAEVFERTVPGGTVATYSAAGVVRRGLADAGFVVRRRPGFGTKRDMSVGLRPRA